MESSMNNSQLTIMLDDRIDSSNAEQTADALAKLIAASPHDSIVLDAENLNYISSAGLRVLLKIRKSEPTLKIVNVSSEVYDIFDMTGFTEMLPIEKAFRVFSVDGCKIIGQGAKGTVYRYNDDTIIKVYKNPDSLPDIQNERALARRAFVLGIPTAISYDVVRVGSSYGSVFELLDAKSYSQLIVDDPDNFERYVSEYALLLKKIHGTAVKPDDMPDIKPFFLSWLKTAAPFLSEQSLEKLERLMRAVPDTLNMLHCDYHTNNVMSQNGETLLIDMDTLSHGHPIFELANVYITYVGFGESDPSNVENFLGIPYDTAKRVWKEFLPVYLGTQDDAVLADVENKAHLLSALRVIRHTARRNADSPESQKAIAISRAAIEQLLEQIDTLEF